MEKQDLLLNIIANPSFSSLDFALLGFTADNVTVASEEAYRNNKLVQDSFKKDDGSFDEAGFKTAYNNTLAYYNAMSDKRYVDLFKSKITYYKDDIFAPVTALTGNQEHQIIQIANPLRQTSSLTRVGQRGKQKMSIDEIAQTQKVWDPTTKKWHDSPNDSWFTDFWDTRVMAQYDFNEDDEGNHYDDPNDPRVTHLKGELKLNENGTYYYENLAGRDIYGRRVLNKMNTLTRDGSTLNKYDFFDSDGLDQKSTVGTLMKNVALVGSMFLPYVGPCIAGFSAITQLSSLAATLGKMLTGSDNSTLSAIEGWAASVNRQTAKSEYAQQHTWCWENMIDVTADLMAQLKEQRFLFEYVPMITKGNKMKSNFFKWGFDDKALDAYKAELLAAREKFNSARVEELIRLKNSTYDIQKLMLQYVHTNASEANAQLNTYIKGYQKIGEVLSKSYMAGLISSQLYGEAKANGVSDVDATFLTLGRFAAEMALLNTPMGDFILPEIRAEKLQAKGILRGLSKNTEGKLNPLFGKIAEGSKKVAEGAEKVEKIAWYKQLMKWGSELADKGAEVATSNTTRETLMASLSNGIEVGLVNDIEEFLNDMAKQLYNVKASLAGDKTRLTPWESMLDRYGMGLVSGVVGGTITSAHTNYGLANNAKITDFDTAWQQLIYLDRQGLLDLVYKLLDSDTFEIGNRNLSATEFSDYGKDGLPIWKPAKNYADSQDFAMKKAIRTLIDYVHQILESEGCNISDNSFLNKLTLGDLRFNALANSTTASRFLQEFNSVCTKIVKLSMEIKNNSMAEQGQTDRQERNAEKNETEDKELQKSIKEKEKELKDLIKQKDDMLDGKWAIEYIRDATYEMTPFISEVFVKPNFATFAEFIEKKKFDLIAPERKNALKIKYDNWKDTEKKDLVHMGALILHKINEMSSQLMLQHMQQYLATKDDELINALTDFFKKGIGGQAYQALLANDVRPTQENWLQTTQELAQTGSYIEGGRQVNKQFEVFSNLLFGTNPTLQSQIEPLIQSVTDLELLLANGDLTVIPQVLTIHNQIHNQVSLALLNTLPEILSLYNKQGFINSTSRQALIEYAEMAKYSMSLQRQTLNQRKIDLELSGRMLTPEETIELQTTITLLDAITQNITKLETQILKIKDLPNSPIEKQLAEFTSTITGTPLNITELFAKLENSFNASRNQLDTFNLEDDVIGEVEEALQLINLYRASIECAKTDTLDVDNLLGFNHMLNEFAKTSKAEGYVQLAELDSETANIFIKDLATINSKLSFYKQLYDTIRSQKMAILDRVGTNRDYIFYDRFKSLFESLKAAGTNWQGLDDLESILNNAKTLSDNTEKKNQSLTPEQRELASKELQDIQDGIYDFFLINNLNTMSADKLAELINPKFFNLYDMPTKLLTENLESIDDNSFVWWLASSAAIKATDFNKEYAEILDADADLLIAPVPGQYQATFTNYASAVNGNVFSKFYEAWRKSLKEDWRNKSVDERDTIFEKLYGYPIAASDDAYADYILAYLPTALRYSNIVLTEGIPGSGKTTGVLKTTVKMLAKFHSDSDLLKNVAVIVGTSSTETTRAKALADSLGLSEAKVFGVDDFFKTLASNYKPITKADGVFQIEDGILKVNQDGEIKAEYKLNVTNNPFTLIIVDEVTNLNMPQVDLLDLYSRKYGITSFVCGDMDLSGVAGVVSVDINNASKSVEILPSRASYIRSPKLGISMRTANTQKSKNNAKVLLWMEAKQNGEYPDPISLNYCIDDKGFHGDLAFLTNELNEESDIEEKLNESLEAIFSNLEDNEKVGFIGFSKDTVLYKYLHDKYGEHIQDYIDESAQGLEGRYYIVEASNDTDVDPSTYYKDIYTGLSRASEGTIVVEYEENNDNIMFLADSTVRDATSMSEKPNREILADFTRKRKKVYEKISLNGNPIPYIKRTSETSVKPEDTSTQGQQAQSEEHENQPELPELPETPGPEALAQAEAARLAAEAAEKARKDAEYQGWLNSMPFKPGDTFYAKDSAGEWFKFEIKALTDTGTVEYLCNGENRTPLAVETFNLSLLNFEETSRQTPPPPGPTLEQQRAEWEAKMPYKVGDVFYQGTAENYYKITVDALNDDGTVSATSELYENGVVLGSRSNTISLQDFIEICEDSLNEIPKPENQEVSFNSYFITKEYLDTILIEGDSFVRTNAKYASIKPFIPGDRWQKKYLKRVIPDLEIKGFLYDSQNVWLDTNHGYIQLDTTISEVTKNTIETPKQEVARKDLPESKDNNLPEDELKKTLSERNNKKTPTVRNINNKWYLPVYTFNTVLTGVKTNPDNGMPVPFSSYNVRIDNVNGLMKLDSSTRTVKEYMDIIHEIRSGLMYQSRELLNEHITDILQNYFDVSNVNVKFALKCSAQLDNNSGNFAKFNLHEGEELTSILSDKSSKIPSKSIIAVIGDSKHGDFLEIPLISLPNPISILNKVDDSGNLVYEDAVNVWNSVREQNMITKINGFIDRMILLGLNNKYNILLRLFELFKFNENGIFDRMILLGLNNKYNTLLRLFELFKFNENGIFGFSDAWCPASNLKNLGPHIISQNRNGRYEFTDEYNYEVDYYDILDLANLLPIKISPVMMSMNSRILDSSGNEIVIDGESSLLYPSMPFVLYTYDKSVSNLAQRYIYELENPNAPKKVQISWLLPEKASILEYINSLNDRLSKNTNADDIGNTVTAWLMLLQLMQDDNFRNSLNIQRKEELFLAIDEFLRPINEIANKENSTVDDIITELNKTTTFPAIAGIKATRPVNKYSLARQILARLVFQFDDQYNRIGDRHQIHFHQDALDLVIESLKDFPDIFYSCKIPKNVNPLSWGDYTSPFYEITGEDWIYTASNGKKITFKSHGALDSPTFETDLEYILNTVGVEVQWEQDPNHRGQIHLGRGGKPQGGGKQTLQYINGEYSAKKVGENTLTPQEIFINTLESKLPEDVKGIWNNLKPEHFNSNAEIELFITNFIFEVNNNTARIAIPLTTGEFFILDLNMFPGGKTIENISLKAPDGSFTFVLKTENNIYDVNVDGSNRIEFRERVQAPLPVQIRLNDANLVDYQTVFTSAASVAGTIVGRMFNNIAKADNSLMFLLNAITNFKRAKKENIIAILLKAEVAPELIKEVVDDISTIIDNSDALLAELNGEENNTLCNIKPLVANLIKLL